MLITNLSYRKQSNDLRNNNKISRVNCSALSRYHSADNIPSSNLIKATYGILPLNRLSKAKNVSFSSNPLYNINLKKLMPNGKYEFVAASFSQLIKNDKNDMECVSGLKKAWGNQTAYGGYVSNDFLRDRSSKESYFVTEIINPDSNSSEKITCIMQTTNPALKSNFRGFLDVKFIQASPEIANKAHPKFKGSGELSLYGVVKMAKEKGFEKIRIVSFADKFYKKIGFHKKTGLKRIGNHQLKVTYFELESSDYDSFLKRVSKKYKMN